MIEETITETTFDPLHLPDRDMEFLDYIARRDNYAILLIEIKNEKNTNTYRTE